MATWRTESSRGESLGGVVYDAFISYSHAADGLLAPRLQSALQRFAKPWWQRRVLRLFVDESSLSANPHLWRSITDALDASRWFVLLLSPDAASSGWVNQEIERADLPGLEPAAVFGPFPSRITGIAPSGDGKRLALVSADEVVRVVDARTGDLLDLVPLDEPIDAAWIDDQRIGVGTRDFWTVVTLDLEQLTDLGRKRLTRTFTDEERDFYGIGNTQL